MMYNRRNLYVYPVWSRKGYRLQKKLGKSWEIAGTNTRIQGKTRAWEMSQNPRKSGVTYVMKISESLPGIWESWDIRNPGNRGKELDQGK